MIRISLPERVPLSYAFIYAAGLFLLQQLEHTSLYFSACSFLFIVIIALAFNVAGGLTRPSGGYIFFYALGAVLLGITVKAVLGEPADSNLLRPHLTITIYAVTSLSLLLAASISRRFSKARPFLASAVNDSTLPHATIGCLAIGVFLTIATRTTAREAGTAWSALLQINRFCELAIILGVTSAIRSSGGRRSVNVPVLIATATLVTLNGFFGFSKEGFFTPPVCWLLAAGAQRYSVSRAQIIYGVLFLVFVSYYMVPYSQYGRTQSQPGLGASLDVSVRLLSDLPRVRRLYLADEKFAESELTGGGYFNHRQGIFDRLQMLSFDDMLTDATERDGIEGLYPLITDFENLIPHALWPGKPKILWGNVYAHEAGVALPEDDFSTGVSFSPSGEAYHIEKWTGVLLIAPLLWIACFIFFDSLCGNVRNSPWGLLAMIYFANGAPEGMLAGVIYSIGYLGFAITFAAFATGYVMPILGGLFIGPGRIGHAQQRQFFPTSRQQSPTDPTASPESPHAGPPAIA